MARKRDAVAGFSGRTIGRMLRSRASATTRTTVSTPKRPKGKK